MLRGKQQAKCDVKWVDMKKKERFKSSSKEQKNGQSRSTLECLSEYSNGAVQLWYAGVLILLFPIQLVDQAWKLKDRIEQPARFPPPTPLPLPPKPKRCSRRCCPPHGKLKLTALHGYLCVHQSNGRYSSFPLS